MIGQEEYDKSSYMFGNSQLNRYIIMCVRDVGIGGATGTSAPYFTAASSKYKSPNTTKHLLLIPKDQYTLIEQSLYLIVHCVKVNTP